jgi:hypothetical protein
VGFRQKLSEKSLTPLQRSLTGDRNSTFRPVLAFVYRLNLRSKRCFYPFSDSFLELDFSHLRVKELEIGSSAQCATSADPGAYHPPSSHDDALYGPFAPLLSKRLFQHVQDSYLG